MKNKLLLLVINRMPNDKSYLGACSRHSLDQRAYDAGEL